MRNKKRYLIYIFLLTIDAMSREVFLEIITSFPLLINLKKVNAWFPSVYSIKDLDIEFSNRTSHHNKLQ